MAPLKPVISKVGPVSRRPVDGLKKLAEGVTLLAVPCWYVATASWTPKSTKSVKLSWPAASLTRAWPVDVASIKGNCQSTLAAMAGLARISA